MDLKSFFALAFIGMAGCTPKVSVQIHNALQANEAATDSVQWSTSPYNPRAVFTHFREQAKTDSDVGTNACKTLSGLSLQDLSLFEQEINDPANKPLLESCQAPLVAKIAAYWEEQKKSMASISDLDFKFETQVQYRDLSHGYRARTADVGDKQLVLTFDDGPDATLTPKILDILKVVNAQVMFFAIGRQVLQSPAVVYREGMEGHRIGSHSMGIHPYMKNVVEHLCLANTPVCAKSNGGVALTFDEAKEEIRGGHQAVKDAAGFVDPFFRFPFGESDPELTKYIADHEVGQFYWSIDSGDWRNRSNEEVLADVLGQVQKEQRGMVLFHDVHRRTLEILPTFLKTIHDLGYTLVVIHPMDEQARYHSKLLESPMVGL
jgi:peptidoglycan/xylan/chitin deacetylase (PgdA/CDA1 family)